MINLLSSQARTVWTYVSTDRKEHAAFAAAAIVITSLAYSVFGRKALFISACALYSAFYFRTSFSNSSASLIAAVISLPLCGFINPLSAIPSGIYLVYYILKHQSDQKEEIDRLKKATERLEKAAGSLESNNKTLKEALVSREELEALQKEFTALLSTVEETNKLYENRQ